MLRVFLLSMTIAGLAGCASSNDFMMGTAVPFQPLPTVIESDVRTAEPGDIIFEQDLLPMRFARLEAPVVFSGDAASYVEHNVPADAVLYRLVGIAGGGIGYCTIDNTVTVRGGIPRRTWEARSCFADFDRSGNFDQIYTGATFSNHRQTYSANSFTQGLPLPEPVRYSDTGTPAGIESIRLGVQYDTESMAGFFFNVVAFDVERGHPYILIGTDSMGNSIFRNNVERDQSFPQFFEILGVTIEVLDFTDGTIRYRVTSGFDSEAPITLE